MARSSTNATLVIGSGLAVRLVDAPGSIADQVRRELGGVTGDAAGLPELRIRHVDQLGDPRSLTRLGLTGGGFAYDRSRFFVLDRDQRLVALDGLEGGGAELEVMADRRVASIPHLTALAGLLMLARRRVLLHASSFIVDGRAVLVPGWQSGGKSELMLGFMATGHAQYAGDEWTVVDAAGSMEGIASHPQLWSWQLAQLPHLRSRVSSPELRRLRVLAAGRRIIRGLPRGRRRGLPARLLSAFDGWLANADRVSVDPGALFKGAVATGARPIDRVLLPSVGMSDVVEVAPIDGVEVADRMAASLAYERRGLEAAYAQFRYAFPNRRWPQLDAAPAIERTLLRSALASIPAHTVRHPYPPDLAALATAARGVIA